MNGWASMYECATREEHSAIATGTYNTCKHAQSGLCCPTTQASTGDCWARAVMRAAHGDSGHPTQCLQGYITHNHEPTELVPHTEICREPEGCKLMQSPHVRTQVATDRHRASTR